MRRVTEVALAPVSPKYQTNLAGVWILARSGWEACEGTHASEWEDVARGLEHLTPCKTMVSEPYSWFSFFQGEV